MLKINTKAPEIVLPDQDGVVQKLSSFLGGWVLVYFYPKDDTPGCTKEACAFRDNLPHFEKLGVKILGISADKPEKHQKFIGKYGLNFTLLADEDRETIAKYGAEGSFRRTSYLIDPRGMIRKVYDKVKPADHAEEVRRDVAELQKI
jgi:thioredoxin-dependent peroxiredoxin